MAIYEPSTDNNIRYVLERYGINVSNMRPDETLTLKEDEARRIDLIIKDQNFIAMFPYKAYGIKCKTVDKGEAQPNYYVFIFHYKYISESTNKHIRKEIELPAYNLIDYFKRFDNDIGRYGHHIWPTTLKTHGVGHQVIGGELQTPIIFEMCKAIRDLKIECNQYKKRLTQMTRTVEKHKTKIVILTEYMSKIDMLEAKVVTLSEDNHNLNMEMSSLHDRLTALEPEPTHETVKVRTHNRIFKIFKKNKNID